MSLSWLAEQIIHASKALTGSDKTLLLVLAQLDRGPEGAFIGQARLAERTGMGADNVKDRRQGLVDAGLLRSEKRPGKRTASWFVTWPETIPLPTGGKFDEAKLLQLRDDFDGFIRISREDARAARAAAGTRHTPGDSTTPVDRGSRAPGSNGKGDSDTPVSANRGSGTPVNRGTGIPLGGGLDYPAEYGSESGRGDSSGELLSTEEFLITPNLPARLRARDGERSHERDSQTTPSAEHVSAVVHRALDRYVRPGRQVG